jgi:HD-GYP domain-containing protein (c-di-GMP phosphodiesterase class II)
MPEYGLKTLLEKADDILFVLNAKGQILSCKSRSGTVLRHHPLRELLNVQDILPSPIKRKFDLTFRQFLQMSRPTMFDSMVVHPPNAANWYEFRLIPAFENQIVLFIWNINNYRKFTRTVSNIPTSVEKLIEGWSRSLYLRDFETDGHTRRVMEMATQLGLRLGLPNEELTNIRRGAQVHDIGKIAIPDEILLKTGRLTNEEWDVMRQHPLIAVEMLKSIPEFEPALIIPRSHHEKWDGSGYPDGLAGSDIPLAARIFSFADVYDALTSDRPYRQAWSRVDTLRYIRSEIGKHFDPALAPEFIRLMLETT